MAALKREKNPTNAAEVVQYFAGSFADKLLARIKAAFSAGSMGDVLRVAPAPVLKEVKPPPPENNDVAVVEDVAVDPGADPAVENADPGVDGASEAPPPLAPRTMTAYTGAAPISQGVSFVGIANRDELLKRTQENGADVLLIVQVTSLLTTKGQLNTGLELELVEPQSGALLKKSKEVNNLEYFFSKENPRNKDPVETSLDEFFKYVVDNLYLQAMPQLAPEHVARRVGAITAQSHDKPLSLLAEILYYRNQKLMTDEQFAAACAALLGAEDGERLAAGPADQKKQILDKLLDAAPNAGVQPGEVDFFAAPAESE
jgi:hypothetical protein